METFAVYMFLTFLSVITAQGTLECNYEEGYGKSKKKEYLGPVESDKKCEITCMKNMSTNPSINGITYKTSTKQCWCDVASTGAVYYRSYKTCLFQPPLPPISANCGLSSITPNDEKFYKRIVGGKISLEHLWPWQVGLFDYQDQFFCGGTIISKRFVVTAAHCMVESKTRDGFHVRLGDQSHDKYDAGEISIKVKRIILTGTYQTWSHNNDIALLELEKDITFSNKVTAACLPKQNIQVAVGTECYVSGWGRVHYNGQTSSVLKHLQLNIIDNRVCNSRNGDANPITNVMVCGYNQNPSISDSSTCRGDSGGPLVCQQIDGRWVLQGVVSWGSSYCDSNKRYSVYTRVSQFVTWIRMNM